MPSLAQISDLPPVADANLTDNDLVEILNMLGTPTSGRVPLSQLSAFLGRYPAVAGEVGVVNRAYPVGDVHRYGAVGQITSAFDTTAFANALTSVEAVGTKQVIVHAGCHYRLSATFAPTLNSTELVCLAYATGYDGYGVATPYTPIKPARLFWSTNPTSGVCVDISATQFNRISGVVLDGLGVATTVLKYSGTSTIEHCTIQGGTQDNLSCLDLINSAVFNDVTSCYAGRWGHNIAGASSTKFTMRDCRYRGNGTAGVGGGMQMRGGRFGTFRDVGFESNNGAGLSISRATGAYLDHLLFESCWFEGNINDVVIDGDTDSVPPSDILFKNCHGPSGTVNRCVRLRMDQCYLDYSLLTLSSTKTIDSTFVDPDFTPGGDPKALSAQGVRTVVSQREATTRPTYGTTVTIDASTATRQEINVSDGVAFGITSTTTPARGWHVDLVIKNGTAGAMGTITFNGVFKLATAWTNPAAGFSRTISFRFDGGNWVETGRTAADVPN